MGRSVKIGGLTVGAKRPLALIAGPCVIENRKICLQIAGRLARMAEKEGIPLIFKASYDKANRSSITAFRGPGMTKGLEILEEVKEKYGLPILTDVHAETEVPAVARVADVLQIPAFLCRQTDLLLAAGESGRAVNIKKGQFLAAEDMRHAVGKVESTGNRRILLTERGAGFGYGNLVADMRNLLIMRELGYPVIFDATHSVQRPGGGGDYTAGDGRWAPHLARAAVATTCDGVFLETHVRPEEALSDRENTLALTALPGLWRQLDSIDAIVRRPAAGKGRTS